MSDVVNASALVTETLVAPEARLEFLPRNFGTAWCVVVEHKVYDILAMLCPVYRGGYWEFVQLSNGGCFLYPTNGWYELTAPNGARATVDGPTTGIVATLYALSQLSCEHPTKEVFAERFHQLRVLALAHVNRDSIFALID